MPAPAAPVSLDLTAMQSPSLVFTLAFCALLLRHTRAVVAVAPLFRLGARLRRTVGQAHGQGDALAALGKSLRAAKTGLTSENAPLGVFLQVGFAGAFWLNILLTLLGYIPGIVHAVYIIAKR